MKSTHKARPRMSLPGGEKKPRKKRKAPERHVISEHALVRYMERVLGLDMEAIRETILTPEQKLMIRELRTLKLPLGGGVTAKVVDGVVVTIL